MFSGIKLSRREMSKALLSASVMGLAAKSFSAPRTPDRAFEHGNPLAEFAYGNVSFAAGLHQAQLDQTIRIVLALDDDSLLKPFRQRAGFNAPGEELGGWYGSNGRSPGQQFGKWLSALSRYHAITGSAEAKEKVARLVNGFGETIDPAGTFYSNYPEIGAESYTFDKLICGLADAHQFAQQSHALDLLSRATSAAIPHFPQKIEDGQNSSIWAGVMPENFLVAWQRGGSPQFLALAQRYLNRDFFGALAAGRNVLGGRHEYGHMSNLCSAAKAYLVFGDRLCLEAAVNGFAFAERQSFATGGYGPRETFLPQSPVEYRDDRTGELRLSPGANTLADTLGWHHHFETGCGSYTHFKLSRYLLRITKNPHYGDSMERVMYNCALGALPLTRFGNAFYQSDYGRYASKRYFDGYGSNMEDEWPCCSGSLPQLAADYRISAYFRDDNGVYVNLYIPSTLRWSQAGADVALTQAGAYPLSDSITFDIHASSPKRFALRFRIPAWAEAPSVSINGVAVPQRIVSGSFATLTRTWRTGDTIELRLPKRCELKAVDAQHPNLVALVNGPIVLFAIGYDLPKFVRNALLAARQTAPGSAEWRSGDVRFLPWWAIMDEVYTTYFDVS